MEYKKVISMSYLFNKCYSLTLIPNLNKWDFKNVKRKEKIFESCISLKKSLFKLNFNINKNESG